MYRNSFPIPVLFLTDDLIITNLRHDLYHAMFVEGHDFSILTGASELSEWVSRNPAYQQVVVVVKEEINEDALLRKLLLQQKTTCPNLQVWAFSEDEIADRVFDLVVSPGPFGDFFKFLTPQLRQFIASVTPVEK